MSNKRDCTEQPTTRMYLPVYLSYGMGVESSAILLRWLADKGSRDFDLSELTVITAQTGNEYDDTAEDVTNHILPRMRDAGVRFVQVARAGHLEEDGIEVLDDTLSPFVVYHQGAYRLSDELMLAGTVPQFGSVHTCSLKFKAWPIEVWLEEELAGQPFRQCFGYNVDETSRIAKSEAATALRNSLDTETTVGGHRMVFGFNADEIERIKRGQAFDTPRRISEYPLKVWGWTRLMCLEYIKKMIGVIWKKSSCVFCPFNALKADGIARMRQFPERVAHALLLEQVSLSMNPRGTLYQNRSLRSVIENDGNMPALSAFKEKLDASEFALYRVRRIYSKKGKADRAVERIVTGTRSKVEQEFVRVSSGLIQRTQHGINYAYEIERPAEIYPAFESFYVCAPATVPSKTRYGFDWFDAKWNDLNPAHPTATLGARRASQLRLIAA
jgi:hypothetical protein